MEKELAIMILNEVLHQLDMNPNELAMSLGMQRSQGLYDVLNPKKKVGISKNLADKIVKIYPQFNKSFLLTGEGDLLKINVKDKEEISGAMNEPENKYYNIGNKRENDIITMSREVFDQIIKLNDIISVQQKTISTQSNIIEFLAKKID